MERNVKTRKLCYSCKIPHHDHWECSKCHSTLAGMFIEKTWKNCPFCGEPLERRSSSALAKKILKDYRGWKAAGTTKIDAARRANRKLFATQEGGKRREQYNEYWSKR